MRQYTLLYWGMFYLLLLVAASILRKAYYYIEKMFTRMLFILLLTASCQTMDKHDHLSEGYYTCPMHPSVRSDKPAACPVCGMALVKVENNGDSTAGQVSNRLMLEEDKQLLANIAIDTVRFSSLRAQTTLTGKVVANENSVTTITARVNGRVDKLFFRQAGEQIVNGQALYNIYSEELLADQNDYLSALLQNTNLSKQQTTFNDVIRGGRKKLLLWGMTESQIKNLEISRKSSALLTYYSGYQGIVTQLLINEGEYTEIGKPLFQITDLSSVWVETQVYTNEIKLLHEHTEALIRIEAFPEKMFKGVLAFSSPSLEENSKIYLARFRIDNESKEIKPGMMARVKIFKQQKQILVIPKTALLIGSMTMVWIENGPGVYESRMVEIGVENEKFVEVLTGLRAGERVVTSGAYLLNSEYILKKGAVNAHSH